MKTKTGKVGKVAVLFIVTIMALASIGTSYAMWSDTLIMDVMVNTGTLNWKFTGVLYIDENYGVPDYHCNPGFEGGTFWQDDKDVGWGMSSNDVATCKCDSDIL